MSLMLQNITDIHLMPLKELYIDDYIEMGDPPEYLHIKNVELESSYNIEPITTKLSTGGNITLAHSIDAKVFIPYNYYVTNNLITTLRNLMQVNEFHRKLNAKFGLGTETNIRNVNATNKMWFILNDATINFSIENVDLRPRLIIQISATEILTNSNFIGV